MLKGVGKNLSENYNQKITSIHKGQLKNKKDVPVTEAFELYMLKKFFSRARTRGFRRGERKGARFGAQRGAIDGSFL